MNPPRYGVLAGTARWPVVLLLGLGLGLCLSLAGGNEPRASGETPLQCPSGAGPACTPGLAGVLVMCEEGGYVDVYESVSRYCRSCHQREHRMSFDHPVDIAYPVSREGFRPVYAVQAGIELSTGFIACTSCHSGDRAESHFLVGFEEYAGFCDRCHLTGMQCPSRPEDQHAACYPGWLNDRFQCTWGAEESDFPSPSEYCAGCHEGHERIANSHPVEVTYPVNRNGFVPAVLLEPEIRLVAGRITCDSCHAVAERGFWACRSCHDL